MDRGALSSRREGLSATKRALLERRLHGRAAGAPPAREPIPRRQEGGRAPMSYAQQQLWFLEQLQPGMAAYNNPGAVLLEGPLDVPALARGLREIVRRHEALRTTFALEDGEPVQLVRSREPAGGCDLPLIDLSVLPGPARASERERRISEEAHRPFDLARGPVLRTTLLRLGEREHVALVTMHHIVSDEWSHNVLIRELGLLYDAFTKGRPSPLPELPVQFGDFAAWQRQTLRGETLERHLGYWRERMAGAPPLLALPGDRPRPPAQSFRGASRRFKWPPELAAQLAGLGRDSGATLFMVLAAGFLALLHRVSHQDDLVLATSSGHRGRRELEPLVGCFLNVLPLRADVSDRPSFAGLLARVSETTLGALAHQDLPFELLVEALQPERDLAYNPLAQVMLVVQNAPASTLELHDLVLTRLEVERRTAQLDLTLHVWERPAGLDGFLEYSTDLFEEETAERLLAHLRRLLAAAAQDPARPIDELPLLDPAERDQVVRAWNATRVDLPGAARRLRLHDLVAQQTERTPDAVAVEIEGGALTYRQLRGRALRLARRLVGQGVGPDQAVAVFAERSLELVVGLLAVLEAGGAYVPLDPGDPPERLAWMLADSGARTLLVQPRLAGALPAHGGAVVPLDAEADGAEPEEPPAPVAAPESLAYIIYTSGSTGRPKGAMNTHAGIVNRLLWMQDAYGLTPGDRVLQKTPVTFDVSVWELFWPLITGARLVLARPGGHQDPAYLAGLVRDARITTLHFVPSMLSAFLDQADLSGCASVRRVIASGEALPSELVRRFYGRFAPLGDAALYNLYGPTEAAVDVTAWACRREDAARATVPIGHPIANLRIHLLDHRLEPVPAGVVGELYIGGAGLARGYLGRPDLTAERFVPDPLAAETGGGPGSRLYRTGDLARLGRGEAVEFLGRIDQQVKLRGFRIELGEVEAVLAGHPEVAQAAVLLREGEFAAFYVPAAGASPTPARLRAFVRERLPEHMTPSAFVALPELPSTSSGKVDRRALSRIEAGRSARAVEEPVAPRNAVEEQLARLWQEVLGVDRVGVHDSFFGLGGHSLLATQLVSRIQGTFHVALPLREVFAAPTVAAMAPVVVDRLLQQMGDDAVAGALAEAVGEARSRA